MLNYLKYILVLVTITGTSLVYSWHDTGHMLVAQIAYNYMTEAARCRANKLIDVLASQFPESNTFVTAAAWPDDLKRLGNKNFNSWHNINIPYAPHYTIKPQRQDFINLELKRRFDIIKALELAKQVLSDPQETLENQAVMLRFLIHLTGDAHQPLHAISYYSPQFRTGDRGGSLFELKGKMHNLHSVWDAMGDLYKRDPRRPLNKRDARELSREAREIINYYPPESFPQKNNLSFRNWLNESYKKAARFAYRDIKPFSYPSKFYLKRTKKVAESQVALAGYRLAALLNSLFRWC